MANASIEIILFTRVEFIRTRVIFEPSNSEKGDRNVRPFRLRNRAVWYRLFYARVA